MKKIGVNFIEKAICFFSDSQQGVELVFDVNLDTVKQFAPVECQKRSCLMWDFEAHTCTVCEDYCLTEEDRKKGCIITEECFVERNDLTYPCDADYNEFLEALGYEQYSFSQAIDESDLSGDMKEFLRSITGVQ